MKDPVLLIFASISIIFLLFLILKAFLKFRACVLCASVGLTWITLLVLYRLNIFNNPVLIALLIGNTVVGVYYLMEKKVPERFHVFKLPFFLTLLLFGYCLIGVSDFNQIVPTILLLAFLWLIFGFLYFYRSNPKFKSAISHIVNCCKNW